MQQDTETEVLWEYLVKSEFLEQFVEIYGPHGAWAELFARYPGYLGTDLVRDTANDRRFITKDRWVSYAAYSDMKHRSRKVYQAIDEQCEKLTVDETYIGIFAVVGRADDR